MIQFLEMLGTAYPVIQCNIPEDLNLQCLLVVSRLVHTDHSDVKYFNFELKSFVSHYLGMNCLTDVQMLAVG